MPFDPHIDVSAPARLMLGGFSEGANAGASRRHLDMNQADLQMRQQEFARQQAQQDASDEVWRAVADYAMRGLTLEDFAADHMPNSDMGRRALAMGRGSARQMQPIGTGSVLAPGAPQGMGDPVAELQTMGQGGGTGGGGMGPSIADATGAPVGTDSVMAPEPRTAAAAGGFGGGGGVPVAMGTMPPHPDDERMRRALQLAPAHAIQQVMPHLQDERKRRAMTGTLNYLIDQGLQDNVVTPHLRAVMQYYARAGEPDFAIHELAKAYDEHGKHADAMQLEALRQQGRIDVADINAGSRESIASTTEQGKNDRFGRAQTEKERAASVKEDQAQQKIEETRYVHDRAIEQRQTRLDQLQQTIDNPRKGSVASDETVYMANKEIADLDRHHANLFNRRNALAKERDGLPPVGMKDKEWGARQKELSANIKTMDRDLEDLEDQRRELEKMRDTAIREHRTQTAKPAAKAAAPSKIDAAADALIDEALGTKK